LIAYHQKLAFLNLVQDRFRKERNNLDLTILALNYGGLAAMILLIGLGLLMLVKAYYSERESEIHYQTIAESFAQALSRSQIKATATGEVSLAKGSTVSLAKDQTISTDASRGEIIENNKNTKPDTVSNNDLFQPTEEQLGVHQGNVNSQSPKTTYTIFKSIPYGDGSIMTGWEFEPDQPQAPRSQYCYYSGQSNGKGVLISIGKNGIPLKVQEQSFVNPAEAFRLCVWR
jgi:cytoskeletal protein RodZ